MLVYPTVDSGLTMTSTADEPKFRC